MRSLLIALLLATASPAVANDLPDLLEYLSGFKEEVSSSGGVAFQDGKGAFLPDGINSIFPAQFAVDREVLKKMNENCEVASILPDKSSFCRAEISAEITFDGPRVSLLIYQIENLTPPTE